VPVPDAHPRRAIFASRGTPVAEFLATTPERRD
jgi:hypothetical protein